MDLGKIKGVRIEGRYLYEIEPGRFVTRQRVHQLRKRASGKCERCGGKRHKLLSHLCGKCQDKVTDLAYKKAHGGTDAV